MSLEIISSLLIRIHKQMGNLTSFSSINKMFWMIGMSIWTKMISQRKERTWKETHNRTNFYVSLWAATITEGFASGERERLVFDFLIESFSFSNSRSLSLSLLDSIEGKPTLLRRWKCTFCGDVDVDLDRSIGVFSQHCNGVHSVLSIEHW
jgi:hypothetical protein